MYELFRGVTVNDISVAPRVGDAICKNITAAVPVRVVPLLIKFLTMFSSSSFAQLKHVSVDNVINLTENLKTSMC